MKTCTECGEEIDDDDEMAQFGGACTGTHRRGRLAHRFFCGYLAGNIMAAANMSVAASRVSLGSHVAAFQAAALCPCPTWTDIAARWPDAVVAWDALEVAGLSFDPHFREIHGELWALDLRAKMPRWEKCGCHAWDGTEWIHHHEATRRIELMLRIGRRLPLGELAGCVTPHDWHLRTAHKNWMCRECTSAAFPIASGQQFEVGDLVAVDSEGRAVRATGIDPAFPGATVTGRLIHERYERNFRREVRGEFVPPGSSRLFDPEFRREVLGEFASLPAVVDHPAPDPLPHFVHDIILPGGPDDE